MCKKRRMMGLDRLPFWLRLALYAAASGVLLYLCLAPAHDLPSVKLWDKAEHAVSWAVLTGAGLVLFPRWRLAVALYAAVLGGLVEILQGLPAINRDSDWKDWVADLIGVTAAWLVVAALRRVRR